MQKRQTNTMKGFTIIEVVLVLAIAGLIFLMVFIALPALQRNQRDTQRRDDMSRFMSQISQYQANNNGKIPAATDVNSATATFMAKYMKQETDTAKSEFLDPSGQNYVVKHAKATADGSLTGNDLKFDGKTIFYKTNARCDTSKEASWKKTDSDREFAILMVLEGSGTYCGDNS